MWPKQFVGFSAPTLEGFGPGNPKDWEKRREKQQLEKFQGTKEPYDWHWLNWGRKPDFGLLQFKANKFEQVKGKSKICKVL